MRYFLPALTFILGLTVMTYAHRYSEVLPSLLPCTPDSIEVVYLVGDEDLGIWFCSERIASERTAHAEQLAAVQAAHAQQLLELRTEAASLRADLAAQPRTLPAKLTSLFE